MARGLYNPKEGANVYKIINSSALRIPMFLSLFVKPGGILLITDYCRGEKEPLSEAFQAYVAQRDYKALSIEPDHKF